MDRFLIPAGVLFLLLYTVEIDCKTYDEMAEFYKTLYENYEPKLRPLKNQSHPIEVYIDVRLHSIVSYDERAGTLTSLILNSLSWTDEVLRDKFSVNSVDYIEVPISKIWSPKHYIFNTAIEDTVLKTGEVRHEDCYLHQDGKIIYEYLGLAVTKCPANILKYPLDNHLCNITFFAVEPIEKLIFYPHYVVNGGNNGSAMFENEEWNTSNLTSFFSVEHSHSVFQFYINISRKPMYILLNLTVPLVCLCVLNSFVFLLPESSGERISYSVTILLALVLYLNMIADRLPNSTPISLININIIAQFTNSCFIVLFTILTLWMYNNQQENKPVSRPWGMFVQILSGGMCKKPVRSKVEPNQLMDVNGKIEEEDKTDLHNECEFEVSITWADVVHLTNCVMFRANILFFTAELAIFLTLILK
ncbi:neuronal acetylcholine receptor subunit alpha-9-like [Ostrea edulis]|uniref:neuronal acetylcholine receptor subunit alpha-9-like n=1 Tax=Ostrea edulis TaxID=37623 RepID=UPI0020943A95|nr:neuronal acetylcholine receptor subunit alpha-9-like [Ostrea edulis]